MKFSDSIAAISEAFALAQAEYVPVLKKKTAKVKGTSKNGKDYDYEYHYADLADILEMVIPRLSKQGLAFSQPHCMVDGKLRVVSYLLHKSGEWMHSDGIEISELSPDPQQLGIESTYFRRYDGSSFLGIAPDEDTDGQTGDRTPRKTEGSSNKHSNLCPVCGKDAIIQGKPEYGGGWLCYKQKGGCGAKFTTNPALVQESHEPAGAPATHPPAQSSTQAPSAQQTGKIGPTKRIPASPPDNLPGLLCTVKRIKEWPKNGSVNASINVEFDAVLNGKNQGQTWVAAYATCWHANLFDAIRQSVGKECQFAIKERDTKLNDSDEWPTHFVYIEDVISISDPATGDYTEYVEGKPVTA